MTVQRRSFSSSSHAWSELRHEPVGSGCFSNGTMMQTGRLDESPFVIEFPARGSMSLHPKVHVTLERTWESSRLGYNLARSFCLNAATFNEKALSMSRRALITGITGQDGSYLAELLLAKGYEVHGTVRRVAIEAPGHRLGRIASILDRVKLHVGSLESFSSLYQILARVQPDECYHLAAQSFVSYSFDDEFSTFNVNINGTHFLLSGLKDICPKCRFYFAGSSEMFGRVEEIPQTERSRFHPRSAYGISKVAGFELTRNYREAYGIHASSGILFNHESPRRGFEFVTRKITSGIAKIVAGQAHELRLGN